MVLAGVDPDWLDARKAIVGGVVVARDVELLNLALAHQSLLTTFHRRGRAHATQHQVHDQPHDGQADEEVHNRVRRAGVLGPVQLSVNGQHQVAAHTEAGHGPDQAYATAESGRRNRN